MSATTLRDRLAAVLGPGNDDATAYAQADSVLAVLEQQGESVYGIAARLELELISDAFEDALAGRSFVGLAGAIDRLQDWRAKHAMTYKPFEGSRLEGSA